MVASLRLCSIRYSDFTKLNVLPNKHNLFFNSFSFPYSFRYLSTATSASLYNDESLKENDYAKYHINGLDCKLTICYMRPRFTENAAWARVSKKGQIFLDFYPKSDISVSLANNDVMSETENSYESKNDDSIASRSIEEFLTIPPIAPDAMEIQIDDNITLPQKTLRNEVDSISFTLSISDIGKLVSNLNQDTVFEIRRRKPNQIENIEKVLTVMKKDDDSLLFSLDFVKGGVGSQPIPSVFSYKFLDKKMVGPWEVASRKGEKEIFVSILNKSILQLSGWDICLRGHAFHDLKLKENPPTELNRNKLIL